MSGDEKTCGPHILLEDDLYQKLKEEATFATSFVFDDAKCLGGKSTLVGIRFERVLDVQERRIFREGMTREVMGIADPAELMTRTRLLKVDEVPE